MLSTINGPISRARDLALVHQVTPLRRRSWRGTLKHFIENSRELEQFAATLKLDSSGLLQSGEEWLADHADFLADQSVAVVRTLTAKIRATLPVLTGSNTPRIMDLVTHYLDETDNAWSEDSFTDFVNGYQEVLPLSVAETWALPVILRMILILRLAELGKVCELRFNTEQAVDDFIETKLRHHTGNTSVGPTQADEDTQADFALSGAAISALVHRMRQGEDDSDAIREWLHCHVDNGWDDLDAIVRHEHHLQATYQVSIGNAISSLRYLSRIDWRTVFTGICLVESTLRGEQSGVYSQLDVSSQDALRRRVQKLAARWGVPENLVAKEAVQLAGQASVDEDAEAPRRSFIAYYLIEARGIRVLRSALGRCRVPRGEDWTHRRKQREYFGLLGGFLFGITALMVLGLTSGLTIRPAAYVAVTLIALIPASEWTVSLVHWLLQCTIRPLPLLRFDYSEGIPQDASTMVVIPVIWSTVEEVDEITHRLELHHVATRDKHVHYAILADFKDAHEPQMDSDSAVIVSAKNAVHALNQRYRDADGSSFHLFHRSRRWNEGEKRWMGWERKRGKLVEFVELIRGSSKTSYDVVVGDASVLPEVRYVITLDTDTQLPLGAARRMIATMHLPYNRPRLNESRTRVVSGYGILQPRVGVKFDAVYKSNLARLWSGNPGIDPYSFALSDPYQDMFGQGIFTGKGIFDVDTFHSLLCNRIPENLVLSHDLLEGGFLRTGLLSDIEVIDEFPSNFGSYLLRLHRWVRGDWQLLPWLLLQTRNRMGELERVDLSPLTRWQIVDNLRRSLMTPGILVTIACGLTVLPGHPVGWAALGLITLAIPVIKSLLSPWWAKSHVGQVLQVLVQTVATLLLLPLFAVVFTDAILRTLYRLTISKRNLLEWVSSAEVERQSRAKGQTGSGWSWSAPYVVIVAFGIVIWLGARAWKAEALVLACLWCLSPIYTSWLNRPVKARKENLTRDEASKLYSLASDIWGYYRDLANEENNFLPPDNLQVHPPVGVAHRTSPTNIGMLLCAIVIAQDLGFIGWEEMLQKLSATIGTIEKMDKWHGHLLNWYDTKSLHALPPEYVSTVDSGNLVACLIAARQAVLEGVDSQSPDDEEKIRAVDLAQRMEDLIVSTDFAPLFDGKAGLFTLGYHVQSRTRETILYDLMASEARQASFVAIALGQAPVNHWFKLSRTMTMIGRHPTLMSWSGTMFEYLMPALLMRTYKSTLWDRTFRGVFLRQLAYARERDIPFGISESGYYAYDFQMNYQYRAFGVPGLGFKRGLERDVVVAPYATVLALSISPRTCLNNLRRLEELGARGEYGFYEAIDFTSDRLPPNHEHVVISSYMAHHQGMMLLSLANVLLDGRMISRFHHDVRVEAAELLLQEKVPAKPHIIPNPAKAVVRLPKMETTLPMPTREFSKVSVQNREVCVLSNGNITSVVDTAGEGFMKYGDILVNRWRADPLLGSYGNFVYLRDVATEEVWSPTMRPMVMDESVHHASFMLHKACFFSSQGDIESKMEIYVSPEVGAEVRRLQLINHGNESRVLEITSFVELALTERAADRAHPAFSKLFVETSFDEQEECLVARRRPRTPKDPRVFAAYKLSLDAPTLGPAEYETNRSAFIGRGHDLRTALGIHEKLQGTVGAVADPSFAMRRKVEVKAGSTVVAFVVTAVGDSREAVVDAIRRTIGPQMANRALQLAWNRSQIELTHLALGQELAMSAQMLAARALFRLKISDEAQKAIVNNTLGQSSLWALGISGDLPIVLLTIEDSVDTAFVVSVARCQDFLRRRGLRLDLVILVESDDGYYQGLKEEVNRSLERHVHRAEASQSGVYVVTADTLDGEAKNLLLAAANVVLHASGGSLNAQLANYLAPVQSSRGKLPEEAVETSHPGPSVKIEGTLPSRRKYVAESHTLGGFVDGGSEYEIHLPPGKDLFLPWSNVMANEMFGSLVTELGTGYTWWKNSREFKLTPWRNDPIVDVPSEICYLRDDDSGHFWSATPAPIRKDSEYIVTHGRGYSKFWHREANVEHELVVYVAGEDSVKLVTLSLHNASDAVRHLSVTYYAEWVLGVSPEENRSFIVSDYLADEGCLVASNRYQESFDGATVALGIYGEDEGAQVSWTCDRSGFLGASGHYEAPEALMTGRLDNQVGVVPDACGAVRTCVTLPPGARESVIMILACAKDRRSAIDLVKKYRNRRAAEDELDLVKQKWHALTSQITVETPSTPMNVLLNGWLLYQTISCRMWARTGFYQAGGAFGFRDQLQDSLAVLHAQPELTRRQILLHAKHQFLEGDVQHWWHEETRMGIRTRFSDDLLWLPYAVGRYVEHTGDAAILRHVIPFLEGDVLKEGEDEKYGPTVVSSFADTLYQHCVRAVERALRFGVHGIPLIGSGDWNDGMNAVGPQGRGESVWLGWFLCDVLQKMEFMAEKMEDTKSLARFRAVKDGLASSMSDEAWDGEWYRRAFTDAGKWLGSIHDQECRIDAIAQSWSVISRSSDPDKADRAMRSFDRELVDKSLNIARLLTPPFDTSEPSPGYIQGYPPGIRENGGQYTHGVVWAVIAWAMMGKANKAYSLFEQLLPTTHTETSAQIARYQGEPYVMAADVYGAGPLAGRAGWTWYTGAAGWMYQAGIEWILGIRRRDNRLILDPQIPDEWPGFTVAYRFGRAVYRIGVERAHGAGKSLTADGVEVWNPSSRSEGGHQPTSGAHGRRDAEGSLSTVPETEEKEPSLLVLEEDETHGLSVDADLPSIALVDDGKTHTVQLRW